MKTIEYTITDELGIHARPAGMLVKEAAKFQSKIMVASPKKEVDAKRIMGVMSMGAKKGDPLTRPRKRSRRSSRQTCKRISLRPAGRWNTARPAVRLGKARGTT